MLSQNVLFEGASTGDEQYDPPGKRVISLVVDFLRQKGYSPEAIQNWRDSGWSTTLPLGTANLQIALARVSPPNQWMAQIASLDQPGALRRLFGAQLRDCSSELFEVALVVHAALTDAGFANIKWCIDGCPDESNSSPGPRRG